jgi:hypothetical protein
LGRLKVEFKKPIFLDEEYELETRRTSDLTVEYIYRKDQAVISRGSFDWKPAASVQETERVAASPERYQPCWDDFDRLLGSLSLEKGRIASSQIAALVWSSYWVGMKKPGRQALFLP